MKVLLVSMEAAIKNEIPTYAGGLGVLVGDKLKAAKDMKKEMGLVTFAYPHGYVKQKVENGKIISEPEEYEPETFFRKWHDEEIRTKFGNLKVRIFRKDNVFAIDSEISPRLYVEDEKTDRLKKEILLGTVAARIFKEEEFDVLHMEESHAAFAGPLVPKNKRVVFTTHTPLPHGHEIWPEDDLRKLYGPCPNNMTRLALTRADYVNCVSRLQRDVMNASLDNRADYITNGVHISWLNPELEKVLKPCVGNIAKNPELLCLAGCVDTSDLGEVKHNLRIGLVHEVNEKGIYNREFRRDVFTVGIGRRFTDYKRMNLVLKELELLDQIASKTPLQIVFSGLAHPHDSSGIKTIESVIEASKKAKHVSIAFLPGYDLRTAGKMVSGSDAWLNVPVEESEASGTSWMKAMMNGTVLISTLSGAVPEFAVHDENALIIPKGDDNSQSKCLIENIKKAAEMGNRRFEIARNAIATSARLTANRMLREYYARAYTP